MTAKKQFPRQLVSYSSNSQRWEKHAQVPRKLKPGKIIVQTWGCGEEIPTQTKELLATDGSRDGERELLQDGTPSGPSGCTPTEGHLETQIRLYRQHYIYKNLGQCSGRDEDREGYLNINKIYCMKIAKIQRKIRFSSFIAKFYLLVLFDFFPYFGQYIYLFIVMGIITNARKLNFKKRICL